MKLELDNLVFIFKGHFTDTMGEIKPQIVEPLKLNMRSRTISARIKGERKTERRAFGFDRFMVCSQDDAAAVLFNPVEK